MATKSDRIVVRLESDMRAKLREKAGALGLDDAAYVRMLIYRDINDVAPSYQRAEAHHDDSAGVTGFRGGRQWPESEAGRPAATQHETGALQANEFDDGDRAEEIDIPADPDGGNPGALGELLGASASILDEMMAMSAPPPQAEAPAQRPMPRQHQSQQRTYRPALSNRNRGLQPMFGPGSLTRVVGLNNRAIGSNDFGDGRGNVLRDNMRHLGITGTRAR